VQRCAKMRRSAFVIGATKYLGERPRADCRRCPGHTPRATIAAHHSSSVSGVEYRISKIVLPADTDYSGAMWHGSYVRWLEEARVRHLAEIDVRYDKLVSDTRLELVVTSLNIRYARAARMGDHVTLTQRFAMESSSRVRLVTKSTFTRDGDGASLATAEVTVTPINIDTGKVVRRWPDSLQVAVVRMFTGLNGVAVKDIPEWLKPQ
jgi:acyl-CoA thioester hydrolase